MRLYVFYNRLNMSYNLSDINDIHTHHDYDDNTVYVKNIQLKELLADAYISELDDASARTNKLLSIGVHPWEIKDYSEETIFSSIDRLFPTLLLHPKVFAIGECGLDKSISTDLDLQKSIFNRQIELSEQYQKPMILHVVRAYNEIIEFRKKHKPEQPWIIHGFNSNEIIAKKLIETGCFLSININKLLTEKLQHTIQHIPTEFILNETDTIEYAKHTL